MNCKKAQELMLTDYLDDQMGGKEKVQVEEHMTRCPGCKQFSMTAKKVGAELFLGAERASVPEYLWRRVRETILAEERERKTFTATIFGKLKAILYIPKPALAIVTVVIMLLAIGTVTKMKINDQAAMSAVSAGQAEYFDYLSEASLNDNATFGTSIEKYFM